MGAETPQRPSGSLPLSERVSALHLAPSGLRDVLGRIPVDVECGGIVQYVSRTSDDAVAIQPQQGATQVDFTFRDYRGQPIPMDGYVAIEIVFV